MSPTIRGPAVSDWGCNVADCGGEATVTNQCGFSWRCIGSDRGRLETRYWGGGWCRWCTRGPRLRGLMLLLLGLRRGWDTRCAAMSRA